MKIPCQTHLIKLLCKKMFPMMGLDNLGPFGVLGLPKVRPGEVEQEKRPGSVKVGKDVKEKE